MKDLKNQRAMLCALLDCGVDDLKLIDDMNCNFGELVSLCNSRGWRTDLEHVVQAAFDLAVVELSDAVVRRFAELAGKKSKEGLTPIESRELEALNRIDPYEDFALRFNYLCTEVEIVSHAMDYTIYMKAAIAVFIDSTGFDPIGFDPLPF